ncbi:MAG TPA: DNA polymerase/3'-5' exonuclease PolX, partial [Chloroflexota bacterium]|nr:DNA polymerase/3'-5' exonuclease PolX [Chloroflexota bacterium]
PNQAVARLFQEIGDILEIKGEPPYRFNAYRLAARNILDAREPLDELFRQGRLREIPGIGAALEAKIVEFLTTGKLEDYDRVRREFPSALASLLEVPGLGPTRARAVYQQLGISSVADLEDAARAGLLAEVPGFGGRAVESLLRGIARLRQRETRNLISDAWVAAQAVREAVGVDDPDRRVAVVGSARRMADTVGNLDLLTAVEDAADADALIDKLAGLPNLVEVIERTPDRVRVLLYGGLEVRLQIVPRTAWGSGLVWYTGSSAHVERLQQLAEQGGWRLNPGGLENAQTGKRLSGEREVEVYERLGLPWIAPELREDSGEIEAGQAGTLPRLIEIGDLKGDLHSHTSWTDGTASLEEMARAAREKGYAYLALTDHSQNLTVARGLTPERLAEQRRLVDRVNHKLAPFVVLLGTEMDILQDGRLDFPDEVLATLDYVSASIHSGFRQPEAVMTERIVSAISNSRRVHTLNHPHGRKIRIRPGYEVDMQAVIGAAARVGCALELNATPDRLDLNGAWARRAKAVGARFTISSDAHAVRDLEYMQFGVGSARRGWLTAEDVLNTRPLDELRRLLQERTA